MDVCDDTVTFPVGSWLRCGRLVSYWDMTVIGGISSLVSTGSGQYYIGAWPIVVQVFL